MGPAGSTVVDARDAARGEPRAERATLAVMPRGTTSTMVGLVTLLLVAAAVFALPLGTRPLFNQDEARFGLLAREALEGGRWVLPRVRNTVYLNKPPLYFWTVAAASAPAGRVTDATAPLPSVVAALAVMLAVFAIGRRLWDGTVGLLAAAIVATIPFFFFMAHQVLSDMMVTAWLTWALYLFLSATQQDGRARWALFYVCIAGGIASKGPAALMVLAAALATAAAGDGWRGIKQLRLPMGLAILAVTALPWLLPYLLQGERSYVRSVVVGHYVDWYFRTGGVRISRTMQVVENLGRFLPWTLFLFPAVVWWRRHADGGRRRLLVWTLVLAIAVGLSGEQRARYFLPVMPLLSLLVAEFLARGATAAWPRGRRVTIALLALCVLVSAAVGVAVLGGFSVAVGDNAAFLPTAAWERVAVSLALLAGAVAALVAMWRNGSGVRAGACLAAGLGLVLTVEACAYPARYARWSGVREFATRAGEVLPADATILAYPDGNLSYDFYLRRRVREVSREGMHALVAAPPADALLVREDTWRMLAPATHPGWQTLVAATIAGRSVLLVGAPR